MKDDARSEGTGLNDRHYRTCAFENLPGRSHHPWLRADYTIRRWYNLGRPMAGMLLVKTELTRSHRRSHTNAPRSRARRNHPYAQTPSLWKHRLGRRPHRGGHRFEVYRLWAQDIDPASRSGQENEKAPSQRWGKRLEAVANAGDQIFAITLLNMFPTPDPNMARATMTMMPTNKITNAYSTSPCP